MAPIFGLPSHSDHWLSWFYTSNHFVFGWKVGFLPTVVPSCTFWTALSCSSLTISTPLHLISDLLGFLTVSYLLLSLSFPLHCQRFISLLSFYWESPVDGESCVQLSCHFGPLSLFFLFFLLNKNEFSALGFLSRYWNIYLLFMPVMLGEKEWILVVYHMLHLP